MSFANSHEVSSVYDIYPRENDWTVLGKRAAEGAAKFLTKWVTKVASAGSDVGEKAVFATPTSDAIMMEAAREADLGDASLWTKDGDTVKSLQAILDRPGIPDLTHQTKNGGLTEVVEQRRALMADPGTTSYDKILHVVLPDLIDEISPWGGARRLDSRAKLQVTLESTKKGGPHKQTALLHQLSTSYAGRKIVTEALMAYKQLLDKHLDCTTEVHEQARESLAYLKTLDEAIRADTKKPWMSDHDVNSILKARYGPSAVWPAVDQVWSLALAQGVSDNHRVAAAILRMCTFDARYKNDSAPDRTLSQLFGYAEKPEVMDVLEKEFGGRKSFLFPDAPPV